MGVGGSPLPGTGHPSHRSLRPQVGSLQGEMGPGSNPSAQGYELKQDREPQKGPLS